MLKKPLREFSTRQDAPPASSQELVVASEQAVAPVASQEVSNQSQSQPPQPSVAVIARKLHKLRDELRDVRKASFALVEETMTDRTAIQTGIAQLVKQFVFNLSDIEMAATDLAARTEQVENEIAKQKRA
jgi:hypothetical protein